MKTQRFFDLAQQVGFEPTSPQGGIMISSHVRYDHFDTAAYKNKCVMLLPTQHIYYITIFY